MTKKIIKVEDKPQQKKNIDINKIKDVIVENKDTIEKIVDIAGDLLTKEEKKTTKKQTTKKTKTNKTKSKSKSNDISKVLDLASSLLKK